MKTWISEIKQQAPFFQEKTKEELVFWAEKLKKQAFQGKNLDNLLIPWFALVQEMSFREIGLKHFETQLLAGYFLHQGKIVEMKTGEGKTLASTLAVSLNALTQKGVHVITVNEYLAERDQKWMGKLYSALGLTCGLIKSNSGSQAKKKAYHSDITYLTNSEVVFDYLRDNSASYQKEILQPPFHYALIDEIDSILIDEARTPLILSMAEGKAEPAKLAMAASLANLLQVEKDFEIEEKRKEIHLTEAGYQKIHQILNLKSLYQSSDPWILEILNALKAIHLFKRNKDYIVLNNQVFIVDEFTGRIMEDRRWSFGLHEALEMKEKVSLQGGTTTKSSITYQNFFPLYPKLAGMTGTGKTTEKEFQEIYQLKVVEIPTAQPMIRKDLPDLLYFTEVGKWKAVLATAKTCFDRGQPLLIGTASVEKSEFLSDFFASSSLPHQVLNAKPENVERESEIIAQAGKFQAITIATNMAGRGTDILLGGNFPFLIKQKLAAYLFEQKLPFSSNLQELEKCTLAMEQAYSTEEEFALLQEQVKNLPFSLESSPFCFRQLYQLFSEELFPLWKEENQKVKDLGGLFVLGTERHETRRIDNQLRGRAGRQGDPGLSQFFLSLEDDLFHLFGGDKLQKWLDSFNREEEEEALQSSFLTSTLENAQKKVELYHSELRKTVFEYDEILNIQRNQFFQARKEFFQQNFPLDFLLRYGESFLDQGFEKTTNSSSFEKTFSFFEKHFDFYSFYQKKKKGQKLQTILPYFDLWVSIDLLLAQANLSQIGLFKKARLPVLLTQLDHCWTQHLERMNAIRETIQWRAYGQQDPLLEYNLQAFQSFQATLQQIRFFVIYFSFHEQAFLE